jgi:hypothetical protein
MRRILLFGCLLLAGCGGPKAIEHADEVEGPPFKRIEFKGGLKGVECGHTADKYDEWNGQYKVQAMIKMAGRKVYKYLQLNVSYRDANGKEVAQSIGGPGYVMRRGDSALIETSWVFAKDSLPNKIILTVSN